MRQIICNKCGKKTNRSSRAGITFTTGIKVGKKPIIVEIVADADKKDAASRRRRRFRIACNDNKMDLCPECLINIMSKAKLKLHKNDREVFLYAG